jgi:hypothetical protein
MTSEGVNPREFDERLMFDNEIRGTLLRNRSFYSLRTVGMPRGKADVPLFSLPGAAKIRVI